MLKEDQVFPEKKTYYKSLISILTHFYLLFLLTQEATEKSQR